MKPRKHAELIKAWADGAEIQTKNRLGNPDYEPDWLDDLNPYWGSDILDFRIKPEPKPDAIRFLNQLRTRCSSGNLCWEESEYQVTNCAIKLTFDGETGELKSAEVLK